MNVFLMLKVPAAWICGVRIKKIEDDNCKVGVKHRWINKNPFNSMYFAVQVMAAELSTGALVMNKLNESGHRISMLVKKNEASFSKKATGTIVFECREGNKINEALQRAIETGEGQTFWMQSIGRDKVGAEVSIFDFEWTIKLRS